MSDSIPQLQTRLATLEQENTRLQTELTTCQRSHQTLQERVMELKEEAKQAAVAREQEKADYDCCDTLTNKDLEK